MNKLKVLSTLFLILPMLLVAKPDPAITFSECFLKYDTMNGETEIILYNLRFTRKTAMSEAKFKEMYDLTEFEIKDLSYDSLDSPTAIRILAGTKNFMMNTPVQQLFSNILGVPAEVGLDGGPGTMKMSVMIPMQKNMYVADNNALQVLHNEKKNKALLEFDLSDFPSKPLEVVIGWKEKESLAEKMDKEYQHDADIFRLRHLKYYGQLLEEYHEKTGQYPLQGKSDYQNYVHIAAPHQQKYAKGGPPHKHDVTGIEDFRKELEKGLGRKIDLKFDPQKVPVDAPNFYIYMIDDNSYFLAVHLYHKQTFSNPVAKHYNKVELTNEQPNRNGLWNFRTLLNDDSFQTAINEPPLKEGFFLNLEEQFK